MFFVFIYIFYRFVLRVQPLFSFLSLSLPLLFDAVLFFRSLSFPPVGVPACRNP